MFLILLLVVPIASMLLISTGMSYDLLDLSLIKRIKFTALIVSIVNLFISFIVFISFNFSSNQFQFVQEYHKISPFDFYLGTDGLSIYFMILTTIIMPISLLSNWISISKNIRPHVVIILLLETLLLSVFLVLDILLYYIFFESILPPLFILIGLFGSSNRIRASFFLFLYTLLGSLFLLLSIVTMSSTMGTTNFDTLYKINFNYFSQLFLFYGIFIAFAVKTPTIFLNTWLLKAHVESPLGGSIILAGIVLKLSLYGIFRLILPLLPKACLEYTYIVYLIGVITIIYASVSTLRTIDVKELIAYSSVSHAAVYLLGVFSNTIQGIEGGITLGLAHGFVSSGLFICVGGVLYDRSTTRLITYYRGIAQLMPLFSIFFFILCLANAGTPLTLNFIGEFLSLYGTFERLPLLGAFSSSSIVFSAAYTIYMFNRIAFAGSFSKYFLVNIPDVNKREFFILLTLVVFTIVLGVYPAPILDGLHYTVSCLINKAPYSYLIFFFKSREKPLNIKFTFRNILSKLWEKFTMKNIILIILNGICIMACRFFILKWLGVNVLTDFDIRHDINIITYIYYIWQALLSFSFKELIDMFCEGNKLKIGGPNEYVMSSTNPTNLSKGIGSNATNPLTSSRGDGDAVSGQPPRQPMQHPPLSINDLLNPTPTPQESGQGSGPPSITPQATGSNPPVPGPGSGPVQGPVTQALSQQPNAFHPTVPNPVDNLINSIPQGCPYKRADNSGITFKENNHIKGHIVDTQGQLRRGYAPRISGTSNQPACNNFANVLQLMKHDGQKRIHTNTFSYSEKTFLRNFILDNPNLSFVSSDQDNWIMAQYISNKLIDELRRAH